MEEKESGLTGALMWGTGSVLPVSKIELQGDTLLVERPVASRGGESPTLKVVARRDSDGLKLESSILKLNGETEAGPRLRDGTADPCRRRRIWQR
ncbi:hypothetical protein [Verrucomicrobium spinosum]|uniref:hypothetical protein n=1 Tax=Verrucomicrobium spinosum TaxID=2736 RepID=UPI0009467B62|nr:hypothetical protein [Verrucomicrobium spinosum]